MKNFWKRAFDFSGRSSRREYRAGILHTILLAVPGISIILFGVMTKNDPVMFSGIALHLLIGLFWVSPFIALCVRHEHDLGRSGWSFLIDKRFPSDRWSRPSDPGENRFGPPPADGEK